MKPRTAEHPQGMLSYWPWEIDASGATIMVNVPFRVKQPAFSSARAIALVGLIAVPDFQLQWWDGFFVRLTTSEIGKDYDASSAIRNPDDCWFRSWVHGGHFQRTES